MNNKNYTTNHPYSSRPHQKKQVVRSAEYRRKLRAWRIRRFILVSMAIAILAILGFAIVSLVQYVLYLVNQLPQSPDSTESGVEELIVPSSEEESTNFSDIDIVSETESSASTLSNEKYYIELSEDVSVPSDEEEGLFNYVDNLVAQANQRLVDIDREEMDISKYSLSYDGTTVTIRLKDYQSKYICQNTLIDLEKEDAIKYLAQIIDLEAGAGDVSDFNEKRMVGIVFLIRVDQQDASFDDVFWDTNQYGSSSRWDDEYVPSDEAFEAARAVYEEYQSGSIDVPEWLWCQGMEIWGDIYQISLQYPEIEGQSPQYFTEG